MCTTIADDFGYDRDSYISPSGSRNPPLLVPIITCTDENGVVTPWVCDSLSEQVPEQIDETEVGASQEERKILEINELFEKYDCCTMAENLLQLGCKMESISSSLKKSLIQTNLGKTVANSHPPPFIKTSSTISAIKPRKTTDSK